MTAWEFAAIGSEQGQRLRLPSPDAGDGGEPTGDRVQVEGPHPCRCRPETAIVVAPEPAVNSARLILLPDHDRPAGCSGGVGVLGRRRSREDCGRESTRDDGRRRAAGQRS